MTIGPAGDNVGITFSATLVDQWVRLGVGHAVVSPGSRSAPLALACAEHPDLRTHVHHDERSAAFTALGIGLATGIPAIVVTTSGTAAVELHPAVVEAHQAGVPLLVCTADRPPELQGVHAPQTIDQRELYGESVRWFVEPGPPSDDYRGSWRYLATDAFGAARGGGLGSPPGPVHLNLAFREPLVGRCGELPPEVEVAAPPVAVWGLLDEQLAALSRAVSGRRGVVVAGARAARGGDAAALHALASALGWPVLADHASGLRTHDAGVVAGFDALLRDSGLAEELRPEFVLRLGGLLSSRVVNEWLAASDATQVAIDRWAMFPDPDHMVSDQFVADLATVCESLTATGPRPAPDRWAARWIEVSTAARAVIDAAIDVTGDEGGGGGEIAMIEVALRSVPDGGNLMVSSSMPVRDLEWYASPRPEVSVVANRGANGIDGVTSTALGVALGSGRATICVVGDVAFLHDTNALLGLARRGAPLCVVVVDNDGGGIFSFLPQATELSADRFEQLFGTPHGVDISLLASSHGLDVATAPDADTLAEVLERWAARPRPLIVHALSDRARNVEDHRRLNAAILDRVRGG